MYFPPVEVNAPMSSFGIATVIESKAADFPKGSTVNCLTNWREYAVIDTTLGAPYVTKVEDIANISVTHTLGALGLTGVTAYHGLENVNTTKDDVVVVSGAAGATGSMVVQIAKKIIGCKRVIGIAGTADKCKWVESLGADVCINYKDADFKEQLIKHTEGYVDVYFDNVGGEILDLMFTRVKRFGRISVCGAISEYNSSSPPGFKNWFEVISNRMTIKGLIVLDAGARWPEMVKEISEAAVAGKIQVGDANETIVPTAFEDVPKTWLKLFEGANTGKLLTQIV
jgi:NADPH-dependent curcumin reductase CurA